MADGGKPEALEGPGFNFLKNPFIHKGKPGSEDKYLSVFQGHLFQSYHNLSRIAVWSLYSYGYVIILTVYCWPVFNFFLLLEKKLLYVGASYVLYIIRTHQKHVQ